MIALFCTHGEAMQHQPCGHLFLNYHDPNYIKECHVSKLPSVSKVCNYICFPSSLAFGKVCCKNFLHLPIPPVEMITKFTILNLRFFGLNHEPDRLILSKHGSGKYIVKSGQQSKLTSPLVSNNREFFFLLAFYSSSKVGVFMWLSLHKIILTSDRLFRLGCRSSSTQL